MPLTMAINAWYRQPGRHQARMRAFVADQMQLIETNAGLEVSVGPVEFGTDFGGWHSHAKPHGGWNVDGHNIWLAFNCNGADHRGQKKTVWKHLFEPVGGFKFRGAHPWQTGVYVELELLSVTRWRISVPRNWTIGTWVRSPCQINGNDSYLGA